MYITFWKAGFTWNAERMNIICTGLGQFLPPTSSEIKDTFLSVDKMDHNPPKSKHILAESHVGFL